MYRKYYNANKALYELYRSYLKLYEFNSLIDAIDFINTVIRKPYSIHQDLYFYYKNLQVMLKVQYKHQLFTGDDLIKCCLYDSCGNFYSQEYINTHNALIKKKICRNMLSRFSGKKHKNYRNKLTHVLSNLRSIYKTEYNEEDITVPKVRSKFKYKCHYENDIDGRC